MSAGAFDLPGVVRAHGSLWTKCPEALPDRTQRTGAVVALQAGRLVGVGVGDVIEHQVLARHPIAELPQNCWVTSSASSASTSNGLVESSRLMMKGVNRPRWEMHVHQVYSFRHRTATWTTSDCNQMTAV